MNDDCNEIPKAGHARGLAIELIENDDRTKEKNQNEEKIERGSRKRPKRVESHELFRLPTGCRR